MLRGLTRKIRQAYRTYGPTVGRQRKNLTGTPDEWAGSWRTAEKSAIKGKSHNAEALLLSLFFIINSQRAEDMRNKAEALKTLVTCAKLYRSNLCNQNLIFIFSDTNHLIRYFESVFLANNFLHLTGVKLTNNNMDAKTFYNACLNNRLGLKDFNLSADGVSDLKLSILPYLMQIHKNARMAGDYTNDNIKLRTEKLVGNTRGCIGFVSGCNDYYIPNTLLKEDIRDKIKHPMRVLATYSKYIHAPFYSQNYYIAKNFMLETLYAYDNLKDKIIAST